MSDQSGMSALTEKGALDMAIATLQQRVRDRDAEIERLLAALKPFADMAMADLCLPSFPALTELVNHAVRAKAAYEQKVDHTYSDREGHIRRAGDGGADDPGRS